MNARTALQSVAIVLAAAVACGFVVLYATYVARNSPLVRTQDFLEYYSVGKLILQGRDAALYDVHVLATLQREIAYPMRPDHGVLLNLYPPLFALLVSPLALLPYSMAYVTWGAISLACLAAAIRALSRYASLTPAETLLWGLAAFAYMPVFANFRQGQIWTVLLAVYVAIFLLLRAGREWQGGALLAVAAIKPQYVAPIVLVLLLRGRWWALLGFVGSVLLFGLLSLLLFGERVCRGYLSTLTGLGGTRYQNQFIVPPRVNHSLYGLTHLLFAGGPATLTYLSIGALLIVLLAACALRAPDSDTVFGLAVVVGLLVSPHANIYDLTLELLPLAIVLRRTARTGLWIAVASGYASLVLMATLPAWPELTVPMLGGLGCWLVTPLWRQARRAGTLEAAGDERVRLPA